MAEVAQITAVVKAEVADYLKGMKQVQGQTTKAKGVMSEMATVAKGLGVAMGIGALAKGINASIAAFDNQAKAMGKVQQALKSTGGVVGVTFDKLVKESQNLQNNTLFGDESILDGVTAQLLTFTNIVGDNFMRTQKVALDLSTVLGTDLKSSSIQLGKALNDPIANLSALSRSGIQFSEEQKKVIKDLAESNRLFEAQSIILSELERQYGGQAEAAAKLGTGALTQLQNQLGDITELLGARLFESMKGSIEMFQEMATTVQNWLSIPVSQELEKQRIGLEALVTTLIDNNDNEEIRLALIKELQREYPDFVKNIDLEKASTEELITSLSEYNNEMVRKIALAKREEELGNIAEKQVNARLKELEILKDISDLESGNIESLTQRGRPTPSSVFGSVELLKRSRTALAGIREFQKDLKKEYTEIINIYKDVFDPMEVAGGDGGDEGGATGLVTKSFEDLLKQANTTATPVTKSLENAKVESLELWNALKNIGYESDPFEGTRESLARVNKEMDDAENFKIKMETEELWASLDETTVKVGDLWRAMMGGDVSMGEFINQLTDTQTKVAMIQDSFDVLFSNLGNDLKTNEQKWRDFGIAAIAQLNRIIQALINVAIAEAIAAESKKGIIGLVTAGIAVAGISALATNALKSKEEAPALATGGLAYGPTMAMVGDNPNASVDPEVIAPLSKLKGIGGGMTINVRGYVGDEVELGREIDKAIRAFQTRG